MSFRQCAATVQADTAVQHVETIITFLVVNFEKTKEMQPAYSAQKTQKTARMLLETV